MSHRSHLFESMVERTWTRSELAELREHLCNPWWKHACGLDELGKRVGYKRLKCSAQ